MPQVHSRACLFLFSLAGWELPSKFSPGPTFCLAFASLWILVPTLMWVHTPPKEFSTKTMRTVKIHSFRVKVPEQLWGKVPQNAPRTPNLMLTKNLLRQPLSSSSCHENLNDLITKKWLGEDTWEFSRWLAFYFSYTFQLAFKKSLQFPLAFPFSGCSAKGRLQDSLKPPCTCQFESKSLWDSLRSGMLARCSGWAWGKGPAIILSRQAWMK